MFLKFLEKRLLQTQSTIRGLHCRLRFPDHLIASLLLPQPGRRHPTFQTQWTDCPGWMHIQGATDGLVQDWISSTISLGKQELRFTILWKIHNHPIRLGYLSAPGWYLKVNTSAHDRLVIYQKTCKSHDVILFGGQNKIKFTPAYWLASEKQAGVMKK